MSKLKELHSPQMSPGMKEHMELMREVAGIQNQPKPYLSKFFPFEPNLHSDPEVLPMEGELGAAGLAPKDARFVAIQLARMGYELVKVEPMEHTPTPANSEEEGHTPGPWSVSWGNSRQKSEHQWEVPVRVGPETNAGNTICCVYMGGAGAAYSNQEVVEANARLIAAAPDMLALLHWLDRKGGLGLDVHERIRAAIAKAKAN